PIEWAKPAVSNAVIGRAESRPDCNPARNSSTPVPMLLTTPMPVITTRSSAALGLVPMGSPLVRSAGSVPACGFGHDLVDAVQVDHPAKLRLVDLDAEHSLETGEDLDGAQRVRAVVLLESAALGDHAGVDFQDLADDFLDLLLAFLYRS